MERVRVGVSFAKLLLSLRCIFFCKKRTLCEIIPLLQYFFSLQFINLLMRFAYNKKGTDYLPTTLNTLQPDGIDLLYYNHMHSVSSQNLKYQSLTNILTFFFIIVSIYKIVSQRLGLRGYMVTYSYLLL